MSHKGPSGASVTYCNISCFLMVFFCCCCYCCCHLLQEVKLLNLLLIVDDAHDEKGSNGWADVLFF